MEFQLTQIRGGCMEPVLAIQRSGAAECTSFNTAIWQDILAQAVTGELVAAMNYTALAQICDDPAEKDDALEHAAGERGHAAAFAAEGRRLGVDVASNVEAKYWKR